MGGGEDRISSLPDELLHCILVRLGSALAAARTSVLSRRWRPVWRSLPELLLDGDEAPPPAPSFLDAVDAALGAYTAPTLERLEITVYASGGLHVPPHRLARWLQFASQRVVDALRLHLPRDIVLSITPEIELPACGAAKTVVLYLGGPRRLRLTGLFASLTRLDIGGARMEGSELTALVCTRCPLLRDLILSIALVDLADVSICSDSLHNLLLFVRNTRRLEIVAPKLEVLTLFPPTEAHISAPKLAQMVWWTGTSNPRLHQFADVCRCLRLLDISREPTAVSLMQHFAEVHELKVFVFIANGIAGYEQFLNETNKLPKCETLRIMFQWNHHGLASGMMHILRHCSSTRKLYVQLLSNSGDTSLSYSCPLSCPCRLVESHKIDDIALNSLEVVEIISCASSSEVLEFVEQLSRCRIAVLKNLVIRDTTSRATLTKKICEMIRSIFRPDLNIKFYVTSGGRMVRLD